MFLCGLSLSFLQRDLSENKVGLRVGIVLGKVRPESLLGFFVFPGIIAYKVLGPNLKPPDSAYLALVQKLVWPGLRGLILDAWTLDFVNSRSCEETGTPSASRTDGK